MRTRVLMPLLALSACSEFGFDPIDDPGPPARVVVVDSFVQAALPAVDLLFVVDDTASMAQEQSALAAAFEELALALDDAGILWHVGVVTTDMSSPAAGELLGDPFVLTPSVDDVVETFAANVDVGTAGAGPEAGLAAAVAALDASVSGGVNAGFRRPNASLHVVFVSDADDQSDALLGDPVGDALDALAAERLRSGLPARASAIVGDVPSGCTSANGAAGPGFRYTEVARATDGRVESICGGDFSGILAALGEATIDYGTSFALRATPVEETVRVSIDGDRVVTGWSLELEPPAVVFDDAPAPGVRIDVEYTVGSG